MKKAIFYLCTVFAVISCQQDNPAPMEEEEIQEEGELVATTTIADLLREFQGETITDDTTAISGFIVSSDREGNINDEIYLQDESGSLIVAVAGANLHESYPVGEEIVLLCQGLKIGPKMYLGSNSALDTAQFNQRIRFTGKSRDISPEFVDLTEGLTENRVGQLITLLGFQFREGALGESLVLENQNTIRDVVNKEGLSVPLYFSSEAQFKDFIIPTKRGNITGLVGIEDGRVTLKPRQQEDLTFLIDRFAPFSKAMFDYNGNTLPYQIMFPIDYDPEQSYPLVVFLHGAGERGSDNERQMAYGTEAFGSYQARTDHPAIVVFPQCPSDVMWSRRTKEQVDGVWVFEFPVENEPNYAMEMVIELVKNLSGNEGVDESRIYVTGLSMGGIGVFEFFYYAPEVAAAGVSIAGGHDPSLLSSYANGKAFRLYHGSDDTVVPPVYSRQLYAEMQQLNITSAYSEAEGRGHEWNYVFDMPEYLDWMFAQSK